jgi:glycogen debranching enzyme
MVGWHYLDRSINIWSDSVKLRFGDCPADSPYLWERMSQYVYEMAVIFDGFRLDNAHSTPIHVANYMLQVARSVNNNLFIMAELFTSNADIDAMFVRRLNINGLIREVQNTYDTK